MFSTCALTSDILAFGSPDAKVQLNRLRPENNGCCHTRLSSGVSSRDHTRISLSMGNTPEEKKGLICPMILSND